mmetsp:Transcript_20587/g.61988  ORF Transcript_20587/g.61988 Transcript_20587/m.61988 type:complete len:266 (-) Transcript_20587:492-1289(-)
MAQSMAASRLSAHRQVLTLRSPAFTGRMISAPRPAMARLAAQRLVVFAQAATAAPPTEERFRLNNLSPQEGSRRKNKRKGRGYGAGQGGSCGFGMRGQNSRSGKGTRPGFEGGQTSLYRRLPKLRGIAGGMPSGVVDFNVVNLNDLAGKFEDGEEVSLETLTKKRLLNPSGHEAKLPLKVLGTGELGVKLTFKAVAFSSSAREKIEAGGGTIVEVPGKVKWTRAAHNARVADPNYKPKQRVSRLAKKGLAKKKVKKNLPAFISKK